MDHSMSSPVSEDWSTSRRSSLRLSRQNRPSLISIPSLSGSAVTARRLLDSPDNFSPNTPITPSAPPSSRATSASFLDRSDESTLSLPDADQGPHPRIIKGWTAYSNLTFRAETPRDEEATEADNDPDDEPDEVVARVPNRRRTTQLCGLCHKTRLIGGRQYCAKCTKKYNITDKSLAAGVEEELEATGVIRTQDEQYMLRLYHGETPEPDDSAGNGKDIAHLEDEVLQVESDSEDTNRDSNSGKNTPKSRKASPSNNHNSRILATVDEDEPIIVVDDDEQLVVEDEDELMDVDDEEELLVVDDGFTDNSMSIEEQSCSVESEGDETDLYRDNAHGIWVANKTRSTGQRIRQLQPGYHPYRRV